MNKKHLYAILLAAFAFAGPVAASIVPETEDESEQQELLTLDPRGGLPNAPATSEAHPGGRKGVVRALSPADAVALLNSTEGPAWRVYQVQASACEPYSTKGLDKKIREEKAKQCAEIKQVCTNADNFAHQFDIHASCSALYPQTTVLLTTTQPIPGHQWNVSDEAFKVKAKAPVKKKRKTQTAVNKPKAKPTQVVPQGCPQINQ